MRTRSLQEIDTLISRPLNQIEAYQDMERPINTILEALGNTIHRELFGRTDPCFLKRVPNRVWSTIESIQL